MARKRTTTPKTHRAATAHAKPLRKRAKPSGKAKPASGSPSRDKVRAHRARLRKRGFRLVQMWLPDTRTKAFAEQAHKDSVAIAHNESEAADQAWVDAMSWWNSPEYRYGLAPAIRPA